MTDVRLRTARLHAPVVVPEVHTERAKAALIEPCCFSNAARVENNAPKIARSYDRDVLIAGAGPAGLMSAILLVKHGVDPKRIAIIDAKTEPDTRTKATTIQPGVLPILEEAGVLARVLKESVRVERSSIRSDTKTELGHLDFKHVGSLTNIPQAKTEEILRDRLKELGVKIDFGTKLEKMIQHDGGFDVALSSGKISARFVIGADGTKSAVRKELNIYSPSRLFHRVMAAADLELDLAAHGLAKDQHYNFLTDEGLLELIPLPGENKVRVTLILAKEDARSDKRLDHAKDRQRLKAFLDEAGIALSDDESAKLPELTYFKVKERLANRYQRGNGFLVGDAAHEHSPEGAQGMNTGLGDAHNLASKIARVLDGSADAETLGDYEKERRPIARHIVRTTALHTRLFAMTGFGADVRDAILPCVTTWFGKKIARDVSQLDT